MRTHADDGLDEVTMALTTAMKQAVMACTTELNCRRRSAMHMKSRGWWRTHAGYDCTHFGWRLSVVVAEVVCLSA